MNKIPEPKFHHISVKTKDKTKPPTGANTQIFLDGKPLKMAHFAKVEFHARRMTKIVIELYGNVELDCLGELTTKYMPLKAENNP